MTKKYAVGEVLYLISNKQRQVLPMQVEEEINRRTLRGETVSYKVRLPGADKSVDIDSLQGHGELFSSIDDVRSHLEDSARRAIEEVLQDAVKTAAASFDVMPVVGDFDPAPVSSELSPEPSNSNVAAAQLPSKSVIANVNVSKIMPKNKKAEQEKNLRTEVILPDGTRAKLLHSGVQ